MLKWEGPFHSRGLLKPSLSVKEQVEPLDRRGLLIVDRDECEAFFSVNDYYRFSGDMKCQTEAIPYSLPSRFPA